MQLGSALAACFWDLLLLEKIRKGNSAARPNAQNLKHETQAGIANCSEATWGSVVNKLPRTFRTAKLVAQRAVMIPSDKAMESQAVRLAARGLAAPSAFATLVLAAASTNPCPVS